jgi:hypothetical protein
MELLVEGCPVSLFSSEEKATVMRIFRAFNLYLPDGPLASRLALLEHHLDDTYFAWIGGSGLGDAYYYRLHSPVAFCEVKSSILFYHRDLELNLAAWILLFQFDFHCGSKWKTGLMYVEKLIFMSMCSRHTSLLNQHDSGKVPYTYDQPSTERRRLRLRAISLGLSHETSTPSSTIPISVIVHDRKIKFLVCPIFPKYKNRMKILGISHETDPFLTFFLRCKESTFLRQH